MGDHYAPRKYLEGFCHANSPQRIWVYDQVNHKDYCANIQKVAQEKGFYSEDDERALNDTVEQPANRVLDKLRKGIRIDQADRTTLAAYIGTFLYRVPFHRAHSIDKVAPAAFKDTIEEMRRRLLALATDPNNDTEIINSRLKEVAEFEAKHSPNPANLIEHLIRSPWPNPGICHLIRDMTWRFVVSKGPSFFLTSDNPVFLFALLC